MFLLYTDAPWTPSTFPPSPTISQHESSISATRSTYYLPNIAYSFPSPILCSLCFSELKCPSSPQLCLLSQLHPHFSFLQSLWTASRVSTFLVPRTLQCFPFNLLINTLAAITAPFQVNTFSVTNFMFQMYKNPKRQLKETQISSSAKLLSCKIIYKVILKIFLREHEKYPILLMQIHFCLVLISVVTHSWKWFPTPCLS